MAEDCLFICLFYYNPSLITDASAEQFKTDVSLKTAALAKIECQHNATNELNSVHCIIFLSMQQRVCSGTSGL